MVLPGLEEVLALTALTELCDSGQYDVVVVDCAPTAETLRLLSLPDVLGWWMRRLFPVSRQVAGLVGPTVRQLTALPIAGQAQFDALERLYDRLTGVRELLADTERSTVRLVTNPEQVVVAEARRTATYLGLFGFAVDAVIVNRLLPDDVTDPWFDHWRSAQQVQLAAIREGFAPAPVLVSPLAPEEPVGPKKLKAFAGRLYGRGDPSRDLGAVPPFTLERDGEDWRLSIDLRFAGREEVDLVRRGDELIVTVGHLPAGAAAPRFAGQPPRHQGHRAGRAAGGGLRRPGHPAPLASSGWHGRGRRPQRRRRRRPSDAAVAARVDSTVEAVRAVARAAVEVGRQVLDAVERALDDPATADKLAEVVAGFSRLAEGMRPRPAGLDGRRRPRPPNDGLERIEVS